MEKKDVRWDLLVVGEVDNVTNPHLLPQPLHELAFRRAVHPARGVVHFLVAGVPPPVLKEVLDGGDDEDEDDGDHGDLLAKGIDGRHPVEEHNEEKIKVCKAVELLEQVPGYEAEQGVLGGADPVGEVGRVGMVCCLGSRRHVMVWYNFSMFAGSSTEVFLLLVLALAPLPPEDPLLVVGRGLPQRVDAVRPARLSTVGVSEHAQCLTNGVRPAVMPFVLPHGSVARKTSSLVLPASPVHAQAAALLPLPLLVARRQDEVRLAPLPVAALHVGGNGSQLRVDLPVGENSPMPLPSLENGGQGWGRGSILGPRVALDDALSGAACSGECDSTMADAPAVAFASAPLHLATLLLLLPLLLLLGALPPGGDPGRSLRRTREGRRVWVPVIHGF